MIERQSMEGDATRRKQILWAIERKLAEDVARPIILYDRFATCWQPYVKGPTMMVDSLFDSNRREDWWLDKWAVVICGLVQVPDRASRFLTFVRHRRNNRSPPH